MTDLLWYFELWTFLHFYEHYHILRKRKGYYIVAHEKNGHYKTVTIVKRILWFNEKYKKNNKILAWLNIYTTVCLFIPSKSHVKHILLLQIEFHFVLYRLKQTLISLWESAAGAICYCYPQPFTSSLNFVCVFPFFYNNSV